MSPEIRIWINAVLLFAAQLCVAVIYPSLPIQLGLGILSVSTAWRSVAYRNGSTSPIALYVFVSAIYVFAALIEVAYFGNKANLDPALMGALTDMGVAFLLSCTLGFLIRPSPAAPTHRVQATSSGAARVAIITCLALLGLSLVITVLTLGLSIGGLSRSELYSQDRVLSGLVRGMLAMAFGVAAAFLRSFELSTGRPAISLRVQLFGALAVYALQDLLIFGDRRLPLVALLGVGSVFLRKRFTWPQVFAASLAALVLFAYGFVRNTPPSTWLGTLTSGVILDVISPTSSEFGGMAIIGQTIGSFKNQVLAFPGYLDAFAQVIPRSLFPNRPLAPTEWFMATFYPKLSAAGASYAFNQVIEARLNAGLFGVLAVGFGTGLAMNFTSRLRLQGAAIGYPIAMYIFSFSMRMDFSSILRTAIIAGLGSGFVYILILLFRLPQPGRRPVTRLP